VKIGGSKRNFLKIDFNAEFAERTARRDKKHPALKYVRKAVFYVIFIAIEIEIGFFNNFSTANLRFAKAESTTSPGWVILLDSSHFLLGFSGLAGLPEYPRSVHVALAGNP